MTRALRTTRTLSRNDWTVLASALALLPAVTVGLRLVGLRRLLAIVERLASERRRRAAGDPGGAARTAWLVETAARCCLPTPTCLAKSLVLFLVLRRRGLPAELVIGVTKARGPLEGHAWVRLGGANVGDPLSCIALARLPAERPVAVSLAPCERAR